MIRAMQTDLERFDYDFSDSSLDPLSKEELLQNAIDNLNQKLALCGRIATKKIYCKKDSGHEHLLKSIKSPFHCEIRYCDKTPCIIERFASCVEEFNSIKRLKGLKSLWHFVIGFELLSVEEFFNFSSVKKRHEKIMTSFFF